MNGSVLAFLVRAFYGEKIKHFNLYYPQKGKKAVKRVIMEFRRVTDPASIPHRPMVAVPARALEI